MEDYIKAKELMDMDATELIGSVSEREIENAMQSLSVVFPESYKAFLRDFGGVVIVAVRVLLAGVLGVHYLRSRWI